MILIDVSRELEDLDLDDTEANKKGSDGLSDLYTCPLSPSLCGYDTTKHSAYKLN